ncbi:MAG TPA: 30S ribosomal protein S1 [bacterium]
MTDADDQTDDREGQQEPEEDFATLLEQSLARPAALEPGRRVAAKVLKVGAEWVFLDVGQKGEGVLDVKELLDADGRPTVAAGETLHVYYLGSEDGELRFTTRVGGAGSGTAQLEQAWQAGIPVEGRLEAEIKGGFDVRLAGGARAFCPFSQLGLRRQDNPQEAVGRTLEFRITEFRDKGRSIVVSHRAILEEERRRQRETLRRTLREGMVVKGTVTGLREFGAFIDIGGIEGLLPVSEAGWGRTGDIGQLLKIGQEVEVAIKGLDWERERFTFSLRARLADPWEKAGAKYVPGSTHTGTVARLTTFGAFVTLEEGIDGLVHISKLGEGRRINHPREVLKEGQQLAVTVDEIDPAQRRVSLSPASLKAAEAEAAAYVNRPPASMGTFGELLKAGLERSRKKD